MNQFPWRAPVCGWLANLLGTGLLTALGCSLYGKWSNWRLLYLLLFLAFSGLSLVQLLRLGWRQTSTFAVLAGLTAIALFGVVIWRP